MENPWIVLENGEKKTVECINELVFRFDIYKDKIIKKTSNLLKKENNRKMNRFSTELLGEDFFNNKRIDHSIRFIDHLVGFGVFAEQKIPAFSFIGEYVGEIRKKNKKEDSDNLYVFRYLRVGLFEPLVIDAKYKGNFTRFINHSIRPNLSAKWIVQDGVYHIILVANRAIDKGEQLTYDYGIGYWRRRAKPLEL